MKFIVACKPFYFALRHLCAGIFFALLTFSLFLSSFLLRRFCLLLSSASTEKRRFRLSGVSRGPGPLLESRS